jgi:hypothetical protein
MIAKSMAKKALLKDGKILCSLCSYPVESDANACSHCSEPLDGDFDAMMCPDCKIILANGTHKCYNCGLKFKVVSRKRMKPDDSQEQEREEFLGRLLSWKEDEGKRDRAPKLQQPITPTMEKEEIERFQEQEAKAEREESIEGLAESFKTIISERKERWNSAKFESLDSFKRLRKEEKDSLVQMEVLVDKIESVLMKLLEKNQSDALQGNPKEESEKQRESIEKLETELKENHEKLEKVEKESAELKELQDEIKEVMKVIDDLLGKLPEDEIENFAKSKEYERYENLLKKLSL